MEVTQSHLHSRVTCMFWVFRMTALLNKVLEVEIAKYIEVWFVRLCSGI
jgi:hypothetical protein